MDWLNIHTSTMDSEDFLGCEPVDQATWLKLSRYCIGQENGGRIATDPEWGDRRWQQVFRVTMKESRRKCALWHWEGDTLVVHFYPSEKEEEVRRNRKNGTLGGRPVKPKNNQVVSDGITTRLDSAETEGKGKGRGIGKEEEGNSPETPSDTSTNGSSFSSPNPPPCPVPALPVEPVPRNGARKPIGGPDSWWMDLREGERAMIAQNVHISPGSGDAWRRDIVIIQTLVANHGFNNVIHTARQLVYNGAPPYPSKVLQALKDKK